MDMGLEPRLPDLERHTHIHYPIQVAVLNRSRFSDLERLVVPLVFQVRRMYRLLMVDTVHTLCLVGWAILLQPMVCIQCLP